ncbi:MAG: dehydrogenase [Acidobacteria bacterium]|nr:MAG: dehydrogenase [Acidobacteriota bacterium]
MTYSLKGRAAIITGGSQGLGLAIARTYVAAGASLLLCARDAETLNHARDELLALATPEQTIAVQAADVSKHGDVERLVATGLEIFPQIHILVNNAGVYGPKGLIEDVDWNDWAKAIEINLLGSVLVCRAILPHFKSHGYGKIIQLSGGGATKPLPRLSAYAVSKAAIVRFVETVAEEVRGRHIDINAIAPGALNTRLLDEVLAEGPEKVGQEFYQRSLEQKANGGVPLKVGADLSLFLGAAESDGITGKLLAALWDPWADLPEHLEDLQRTDVYTLRRIIPTDRNLTWGE